MVHHHKQRSQAPDAVQSGQPLSRRIAIILGGGRSVDARALPFGALTTDVATAEPDLITKGRLVRALQASAAISGVFPAVSVDGRPLSDGRVVVSRPVTQALEMGHRLSPLSLLVPARQ